MANARLLQSILFGGMPSLHCQFACLTEPQNHRQLQIAMRKFVDEFVTPDAEARHSISEHVLVY